MRKIAMIIMTACLILSGCENEQKQQPIETPQQSEFERVPEQVEQVKEKAQKQEQAQTEEVTTNEPTGDIKITFRMMTVGEQDFAALDGVWGYTTGSFVLMRRLDIFPESGLRVHMAGGDLTAQLAAVAKKAKYCEESEMFLVLADGATGYINIGTQIAVPRFYYLTRWYEAANYQFRTAGRGFKVTARKIPGRDIVNLQFIPVLSGFLNDGSDKEFTELTTSVTVKPGQSILIGGSRTSRENFSSAFLGLRQEETLKDTVILVNVSLL
jgi:hypothetical protein